MAELGLGLGFAAPEKSRKNRGKIRSRWGMRRRKARDGGHDLESAFYSSPHSSAEEERNFGDEYCWFASAPGSVGGRFSFGSDFSAFSPSPRSSSTNLVVCESSYLPCHDTELNTRTSSPTTITNNLSTKSTQLSASKGQRVDRVEDQVLEHEDRSIDPPIISLRDCQNQRVVTFESLSSPGGHRRWRPGSLDLNVHGRNAGASSLHPFTGGTTYMKNSCAPSIHGGSNMFHSPGTPSYWHGNNVGAGSYQKGWSSERVPLPASRGQRYGGNAPLFPFSNGRTLPSKWEDAERWICSPVSSDGSKRPVVLPPYHRRPKSKSGPLGAPVLAGGSSYASASPQIPCFDNGKVVNFAGCSPFLAGVLITDPQLCGVNGGEKVYALSSEVHMDSSASLDSSAQPSTSLHTDAVFQGYRIARSEGKATVISPMIMSRDAGTQMSPEESAQSSPEERPSSLSQSPLFVHTVTELKSNFPCLEIRDVQVDDRVTMTRWSKKHSSRCSDRRSTDLMEWRRRKTIESRGSDWEVIDTEKCMSKYDGEEAKINAWENLQKAKAEAAVQKLEMKLEKKRSSSMEKILNRLRSAQRKAQDMRSSAVARQVCMVPRTGGRKISCVRKYGRISSLRGCFTCQAF